MEKVKHPELVEGCGLPETAHFNTPSSSSGCSSVCCDFLLNLVYGVLNKKEVRDANITGIER